jgi:hypothetical protein
VEILEFNGRFNSVVRRLRSTGGEGSEEEQARLRELVSQLATEDDRRWAANLVQELPKHAAPPVRSPLYVEALKIQDAAFHSGGSDDERITAIVAAQRQIWDIADRAPHDESADIRALTRIVEHLEDGLRNSPWEADNAPVEGN